MPSPIKWRPRASSKSNAEHQSEIEPFMSLEFRMAIAIWNSRDMNGSISDWCSALDFDEARGRHFIGDGIGNIFSRASRRVVRATNSGRPEALSGQMREVP